jgi:uncharacterized protein YecA (UPF0149 family)
MKLIDELAGPITYEHYPTGWAAAFSTPFKMFKRYSNYSGGTACPLTITWPKGIKARGEVRNQYHHAVDIVPTILEIVGLEMPKVYKGVEQYPLSGVSMKYSFDAKPDDATQKHVQYYTMLGTRAIWQDGWKAVAVHAPLTGKGKFDQDKWELYHVDVDRSESKDLAKENPEKLTKNEIEYLEESKKNQKKKEEQTGSDALRHFEKSLLLQTLDTYWREHLAAMDYLRQGIHLRGYAQKNPKQEYKRESFELFAKMLNQLKYQVISIVNYAELRNEQELAAMETQQRERASQPMSYQHANANTMTAELTEEEALAQQLAAQHTPIRTGPKVGRNDPCPCGSGKKYKQCHGQLE